MTVCAACGFTENTGRFCLRCGSPLAENAAGKKPDPDLSSSSAVISVSLSGSSSGMMYNSNSSHEEILEYDAEKGLWVVRISEKKAFATVKTQDIYRAPADMAGVLRDLIAGSGLQEDARKIPREARISPQVFDYSSGYSLTVWYRESPESRKPYRFSVNNEKIAIARKTAVAAEVRALFDRAAVPEALLSHEEIQLNISQPFFQMVQKPAQGSSGAPAPSAAKEPKRTFSSGTLAPDGSWTCSCGQSGLTGKFCYECGNRRPDPPQE